IVMKNKTDASGTDVPLLQATLRLGLFGGVHLYTEKTSYDWGNGKFTASFPKNSDSALQFRGTIANGRIINAVLSGALSGDHPMMLVKNGRSFFTAEEEFNYTLNLADGQT